VLHSQAVEARYSGRLRCPGRAEVKTNKHRTLQFVQKQGTVQSRDLVRHFGYSPGTARSYLSHLGRQSLLERVAGGYELTVKGKNRIRYFDIFGCSGIACPLCKGKTGYLTCPSCGHRILKKDARIAKEKDFVLARLRAGVYCDRCSAPILGEAQAQLLGIAKEE
jgi:predicted methyltransferase